jgi:hypothetical protein
MSLRKDINITYTDKNQIFDKTKKFKQNIINIITHTNLDSKVVCDDPMKTVMVIIEMILKSECSIKKYDNNLERCEYKNKCRFVLSCKKFHTKYEIIESLIINLIKNYIWLVSSNVMDEKIIRSHRNIQYNGSDMENPNINQFNVDFKDSERFIHKISKTLNIVIPNDNYDDYLTMQPVDIIIDIIYNILDGKITMPIDYKFKHRCKNWFNCYNRLNCPYQHCDIHLILWKISSLINDYLTFKPKFTTFLKIESKLSISDHQILEFVKTIKLWSNLSEEQLIENFKNGIKKIHYTPHVEINENKNDENKNDENKNDENKINKNDENKINKNDENKINENDENKINENDENKINENDENKINKNDENKINKNDENDENKNDENKNDDDDNV